MLSQRLRALPLVGLALLLAFPPWMQDDPDAWFRDVQSTKFQRGHAFVLAPPAPAVAEDPRVYAPPASAPVAIDRAQLVREAITVLVVLSIIANLLLRQRVRFQRLFPWSRGTALVAALTALLLPVPVLGAPAFASLDLLTDVNHGVPMFLLYAVPWVVLSIVLFLGLATASTLAARFQHAPTTDSVPPSA